jgi:assimilatory nitrate reductase catalytic subunit
VQWPLREGETLSATERRCSQAACSRIGRRARFLLRSAARSAGSARSEYPFVLLTGRGSSAQWHTETRTKRSPVLAKLHAVEPCVEIHPDDAARLGIASGDCVIVRSRRGETALRARLTSTVQRGQLFTAMHHEGANRLTLRAFDPHSRQPAYKHCAVSIARLDS